MEVDLVTLLAPCTRLQELSVINCSFTLLPTPIQCEKLVSTLKKLFISSSNGHSQQLLKSAIPSLIELHFGCIQVPISGDFSWNDIPRLYPNLQVLVLRSPCKSLTLNVVRLIVSQLPCLKSISLPLKMLRSDEDKQLGDQMINEFDKLPSTIHLSFVEPNWDKEKLKGCYCPY